VKLKITQPGWEAFNGNLGGANFVNGESVDDVSPVLCQRLAALITIEEVGTGINPSPSQIILDNVDTPMDSKLEPTNITNVSEQGAIREEGDGLGKLYEREELETILGTVGIKGLREIADPLEIKAKSGVELIDKLLKTGARHPGQQSAGIAGDDATIEKGAGVSDGRILTKAPAPKEAEPTPVPAGVATVQDDSVAFVEED
jgi:hypothetical protein